MSSLTTALSLHKISKSYAAPVLCGVDFELHAGEVHALVGANGAGKSTMAKIICGLVRADSGSMKLFNEAYAPRDKAESEHAGVHIVQQELNLIPTLTIAENLYLNRMPRSLGFVRRGELRERAARALAAVGLNDLHPDTPTSGLGVGKLQLVEIASALSRNLRVLILDEPTAMLTGPEIDLLFTRIAELKSSGTALIYISHRMQEIRTIADRVSVLRDGRMIETCPAAEASLDKMVRLMIGETAAAETAAHRGAERKPGPVVFQVADLCRGTLTRDISFEVRRGEILGLSGLVGSGRTETLRSVFGADRPERGTIAVGDPLRVVRIRSPRDAVRAGIGMLPEDRKGQGLLLSQSIARNVTLAHTDQVSGLFGRLSLSREARTAQDYRDKLDIRCSSVAQLAGKLSGGNQQKVLIARWLMRNCDVLLFDEPTRGIDAGARAAVYRLLNELAESGKAIVVASSDLNELMEICDRIAVMSAGKIAATYSRDEWSEDLIMTAAFSGYAGERATAAAGAR